MIPFTPFGAVAGSLRLLASAIMNRAGFGDGSPPVTPPAPDTAAGGIRDWAEIAAIYRQRKAIAQRDRRHLLA